MGWVHSGLVAYEAFDEGNALGLQRKLTTFGVWNMRAGGARRKSCKKHELVLCLVKCPSGGVNDWEKRTHRQNVLSEGSNESRILEPDTSVAGCQASLSRNDDLAPTRPSVDQLS